MTDEDVILWHYTSTAAFLGMVSGGAFWASDCDLMDDAQELHHGMNVARRYVDQAGAEWPNPTIGQVEWLQAARGIISNARVGPGLFVASFSARGDLLSQWRAYCPTGGYSIGFRRSDLLKIAEQEKCFFQQCIYEDEAQMQLVKDAILAPRADMLAREASAMAKSISARMKLLHAFARMKHPGFKEEDEWRLIVHWPNDHKIKFRPKTMGSSQYIVPYVELPIPAIARIVVGPMEHQELAVSKVKFLLGVVQQPDASIEKSVVPYRT